MTKPAKPLPRFRTEAQEREFREPVPDQGVAAGEGRGMMRAGSAAPTLRR